MPPRKSRKRRPSRKSRKSRKRSRKSRKSRKRSRKTKSRSRRKRSGRKKSNSSSRRKRSGRKKSRSRRKSRRTSGQSKKKSQGKIRKTKAIYYNNKKPSFFEFYNIGGNNWYLHLEFQNDTYKTYFVKIKKEKFAQPSFQYKVKQRDYIEEYKSKVFELGYFGRQYEKERIEYKLKLKKECKEELQRIKRGITLTFKQY